MFYLFAFIYGAVALYDVSSFYHFVSFCGRFVPGVRFSTVNLFLLVQYTSSSFLFFHLDPYCGCSLAAHC